MRVNGGSEGPKGWMKGKNGNPTIFSVCYQTQRKVEWWWQ